MNQFYRALHMPPKRLLRKVMGEKEIYTIAVRPRPTAEGAEPLPALEKSFNLEETIKAMRDAQLNEDQSR